MSRLVKTLVIVTLVASLAVVSAGCKAPPASWESMNVTSIMSSPYRVTVAVNATTSNLTISAIYSGVGAGNLGGSGGLKTVTTNLTFLSSDDNIATVTPGGQVRGIAVGSADVTVSYTEGNVTKTVVVPVTVVVTVR